MLRAAYAISLVRKFAQPYNCLPGTPTNQVAYRHWRILLRLIAGLELGELVRVLQRYTELRTQGLLDVKRRHCLVTAFWG